MSRSKTALDPSELPPWTSTLGSRLREIRSERGETLVVVGAATGISPSFLSLLEQGRSDVSLGRLLPLLEYYRLSLAEVIASEASPHDAVVRSAERTALFSVAEGIDIFLAAPDQRRPFIPLVVKYHSGARMQGWSEHDGEEFVFVLKGRLSIEFRDAATVELAEGDTIFFASKRGHRISAAGIAGAQALIITTERDPRDSVHS